MVRRIWRISVHDKNRTALKIAPVATLLLGIVVVNETQQTLRDAPPPRGSAVY